MALASLASRTAGRAIQGRLIWAPASLVGPMKGREILHGHGLRRMLTGEPYRNPDMLGRAVSVWRDRLGLRKQLHLYDARGAAATRLLVAGCRIAEIAAHMGWSIQTAHFTLQRYATANPTMAVGILDKLMAHEEKRKSAAAEVQDDEDHLIEDDLVS